MSTERHPATESPDVPIYDLRGAATYLGVGHTTIRRWITDGYLPAQRVGPKGKFRIKQSDLDGMVTAA